MKYVYLRIAPELKAVLSSVSIMETDFAVSAPSSRFYYPCTPRVFLCFFVKGDLPWFGNNTGGEERRLASSVVIGPRLSGSTLNFGAGGLSVIAGFCPGSFQRLSGFPVKHLVDRETDAASIFGKEATALEAALQQVAGPEQMGQLIEAFLLEKLQKVKDTQPLDDAISTWIQHHGNLPVEQVASLACLSPRQFARKCEERLGLRPKLFARLTRFSEAYQLKEHNPELKWTRIAHELGYHDQMHLIHDFKTFAGLAPSKVRDLTGWLHLP